METLTTNEHFSLVWMAYLAAAFILGVLVVASYFALKNKLGELKRLDKDHEA